VSGYPWQATYSLKPLDPRLYSEAQCLAAAGQLPSDHPAWKLTGDALTGDQLRNPNMHYGRCSVKGCTTLHAIDGPAPAGQGYPITPGEDQQGSDSSPVTRTGPMWPGSCSCGRRWRSLAEAHCPTCHRHFSTAAGFDMHRRDGRCVDPVELVGRRAMRLTERVGGPVWVRLYDRAPEGGAVA